MVNESHITRCAGNLPQKMKKKRKLDSVIFITSSISEHVFNYYFLVTPYIFHSMQALQFIKSFAGIKVEGILRQSADVEEVDWRIQEYEKGNYIFFFQLKY